MLNYFCNGNCRCSLCWVFVINKRKVKKKKLKYFPNSRDVRTYSVKTTHQI